MKKKLSVERMMELESNLNDENVNKNLSKEEIEYVKLAKRLPYNELLPVVNDYLINWYYRNDVFIIRQLINKYSCSEIELLRRFLDIVRIVEFNESKLNDNVKKQKTIS